jgi:hypothetical protein
VRKPCSLCDLQPLPCRNCCVRPCVCVRLSNEVYGLSTEVYGMWCAWHVFNLSFSSQRPWGAELMPVHLESYEESMHSQPSLLSSTTSVTPVFDLHTWQSMNRWVLPCVRCTAPSTVLQPHMYVTRCRALLCHTRLCFRLPCSSGVWFCLPATTVVSRFSSITHSLQFPLQRSQWEYARPAVQGSQGRV